MQAINRRKKLNIKKLASSNTLDKVHALIKEYFFNNNIVLKQKDNKHWAVYKNKEQLLANHIVVLKGKRYYFNIEY